MRTTLNFNATLQSAAVPPQVPQVQTADGKRRSQPEAPAAINTLPSTPPPTSITQPPASPKKGAWAEASGPKKAILVLMPFALATMLWVILDDGEQPLVSSPARPVAAQPASSAAAPVLSQVPARQGFSLAKTPARPDSATPAATSAPQGAEPPAPAQPSASPAPSAVPTAASAVPAASGSAIPNVTPPPIVVAASGASPRAALSAALLGNLDQAAELYRDLAAADPSNQAFSLAARLTAARAVRHP